MTLAAGHGQAAPAGAVDAKLVLQVCLGLGGSGKNQQPPSVVVKPMHGPDLFGRFLPRALRTLLGFHALCVLFLDLGNQSRKQLVECR